MGCISSRLAAAGELQQERKLLCTGCPPVISGAGDDYPNHIVSLTSSTYGILKLDRDDDLRDEGGRVEECRISPPPLSTLFQKKALLEEPEIINAWELMEDLDEHIPMYLPMKKAPGKASAEVKTFKNIMESRPGKQQKNFTSKENLYRAATERTVSDPARVLKPLSSSNNNRQCVAPVAEVRFKTTLINLKIQVSGRDLPFSKRRKSISLFDQDLLASFEKELCEEEKQIKKMVSAAPLSRKARDDAAASLLESFEKKCRRAPLFVLGVMRSACAAVPRYRPSSPAVPPPTPGPWPRPCRPCTPSSSPGVSAGRSSRLGGTQEAGSVRTATPCAPLSATTPPPTGERPRRGCGGGCRGRRWLLG